LEKAESVKQSIHNYLETDYQEQMYLKNVGSFEKLDKKDLEKFSILDDMDYRAKLSLLHDDTFFKYPVKLRKDFGLDKLAISEWFIHKKYSAWDLWAALIYLFRKSKLTELTDVSLYNDDFHGNFLYVLKELYNFTDNEVEEFAGGFDT
jgi:hypothetical protein